MAADVKQLDDRLDKLEEKLKVTFNMIEKKFNEIEKQPHQKGSSVQSNKLPEIDERFNKLEGKLKTTFDEIGKKLDEIQKQPPASREVPAQKFQMPAGMNPHKIAEMDERFGKLEEKLKLTFGEIEKRFAQMQQQPHYSAEDRIEELEDLLLLMQLETTKLREKVGEGLDFGISPAVPDISERLTRMESELASHATVATASTIAIDDTRLAALEEKIKSLSKPVIQTDDSLKETIQALEKKVNTLEALLAQRGREQLEDDDLLTDVQSILRGR